MSCACKILEIKGGGAERERGRGEGRGRRAREEGEGELNYFKTIFPFDYRVRYTPHIEINVIGYGTARGFDVIQDCGQYDRHVGFTKRGNKTKS